MPAEIITAACCQSAFAVYEVPSDTNPEKHYTVEIGGPEGYAVCDCWAFKKSAKEPQDRECKHVQRVFEEACMWNPQWRDGKKNPTMTPTSYTYFRVIEHEKCPACGGPVVAIKIAV